MAVSEPWEPDCLKSSVTELQVSATTPCFSMGAENPNFHTCASYAWNPPPPSPQSMFLHIENRKPLFFSCSSEIGAGNLDKICFQSLYRSSPLFESMWLKPMICDTLSASVSIKPGLQAGASTWVQTVLLY